ncbi:MAG: phosphoribosylaminoimidazolesuccinocarboxamide synthase, partial [Eubacteriaceae bacterium]
MEKLEQLYEGKAKKVFKTDNPDEFIIEYKDDATAFNGEKKGSIGGKGIINNKMTAVIFTMLEEQGIKTHFIKLLSDKEQLVKAVTIFPLEVIIRNTAAGSICKRLG